MRLRLTALVLSIVLFTAAATGWAQTRSKIADELLKLELEMAANNYEATPSDQNLSDYVTVLERVAQRACARGATPPLVELPGCSELADKLRTIDGRNPVAACITHGPESAPCREAFGLQRVEELKPGHRTSAPDSAARGAVRGTAELERQLTQTRNQAKLDQLKIQIDQLSYYERSGGVRPETRAKLVGLLEEAVTLGCEYSELRLQAEEQKAGDPAATPTPQPQPANRSFFDRKPAIEPPTPDPEADESASNEPGEEPPARDISDPMDRLLAELETSSPAVRAGVTFSPPFFKRTRLVQRACISFTEQLLRVDPQSRVAHCRRHGPFAPGCTGVGDSPAAGETPAPGERSRSFETF